MNASPAHASLLHARRKSSYVTVELRGVPIEVEYVLEGEYIPATDTDAAEKPVATVLGAQIGGVDALAVLDRDALTDAVEREVGRV